MGDIQTRPFSKDYSGLINQSVIAIGLTVLCVTSHEVMKRRRRGSHPSQGLGSVESWQFGYLYQGRSWARNPSPPIPQRRPLSWVKEVINTPQGRLNELRGMDAALYVRFLQGSLYFVLLHTFTTVPILLPIHVHFSSDDVSSKSMTRASIASLVLTPEGLELLWIHVCLLFWLTLTWIATLFYVCNGAFEFRAAKIEEAARNAEFDSATDRDTHYHPHPHPQFPFQDIPSFDTHHLSRGLRLRSIMVSSVPVELRSEGALKQYFEHYMSRPVDQPFMGLTSSTRPGLLGKFLAFGFNRAKRIPQHIPLPEGIGIVPRRETEPEADGAQPDGAALGHVPVIERIVIARKMTELASLLERREEILCALEEAHIKLAKQALEAVSREMERRRELEEHASANGAIVGGQNTSTVDLERQLSQTGKTTDMDLLVKTLAPFVVGLDTTEHAKLPTPKEVGKSLSVSRLRSNLRSGSSVLINISNSSRTPTTHEGQFETVWDALHSLPRSVLDPYQPLIHLSVLFRGKTVPSIDYYTAKLNLLTTLITLNRAKAVDDYDPVSTAFVTFKDPKDARRACKYLAVHPDDPLACLVTMAPQYEDIDWTRVMKGTIRAELIKDWVVNLGVWGFTIFWLFPVSLFVGLVSIQSIASFWPSLFNYLSHHPWQQEIIQSFLPTVLVSLLAILIPLILLLIAKKAYNIATLSLIHDTIMIQYYKFLIVNVLVFFCVGVAVLQTFLSSFKNVSSSNILQVVADSFPSAGPFYVGWLIFTTAIHGSLELVMFGLPLFTYPSTSRQMAPRKREVGIRPRTFNFYYWLPNHLLIIHVCLLFAILNPLVVPFGLVYFVVETAVVKNQLLHVYAKNYECNGHILLIRMVRYSLDGLMFSQFVFLAYMVVLKNTVNLALTAVLFILTAVVKIVMTRKCRSRFEQDDCLEAEIVCGTGGADGVGHPSPNSHTQPSGNEDEASGVEPRFFSRFRTWLLRWINFSNTIDPRHLRLHSRQRSLSRLDRVEENQQGEVSALDVDQLDRNPSVQERLTTPPRSTSLVQPHPPHPTWDDEPRLDIPYDNPYYIKPITNVLWLPRHPLQVLDLNDTVDLLTSLTSEPGRGDLGLNFSHWSLLVAPRCESPDISPDVERASVVQVPSRQYSGAEDIDLPEGIRSRVMAMSSRAELDSVEERRPSLFGHRFSSSGSSGKDSIVRALRGHRSQTLDGRPGAAHLSTFGRSRETLHGGHATSSLHALGGADGRHPVHPPDPASRPDLHAQADLVRSTELRILCGGSRLSVVRSGSVSTGEAVLNEAIAEEHVAAERRVRREEADAAQRGRHATPAWLASLVYAKGMRRG